MKKASLNTLLLLLLTGSLFIPFSSSAYSILTHEAIVDANWEKSIIPLLKSKYPHATVEELKKAHAYAYGGAIIADMGYYPFGAKLFTELVHYVRSGDFVMALLDESKNLNDYAFAIGALAHYTGDNFGHPLGTNLAVPLAYPKDRKYGKVVTYEQDHLAHLRMEFGFDILQTGRGNYASLQYHDFIGFEVARDLLEKAFEKTYGLDLNKVFGNRLPLAIGTFRWTVRNLIPTATRYGWLFKKSDIIQHHPDATTKSFRYQMSKADYHKEFGKEYKNPRFGLWTVTIAKKFLPRIGPLKGLWLKGSMAEPEKLFIKSFDVVIQQYNGYIKKIAAGTIHLENHDFDTGKPTAPGEYKLADENYRKLVVRLKKDKFDHLNASIKQNILAFYDHADSKLKTKESAKQRKETKQALEDLKKSVASN